MLQNDISSTKLTILLIGLLFMLLSGIRASHSTEVTSFTPIGGPAGTLISINGSGFTGTNSVIFHNRAGRELFPDFTIESDSSLSVTAPENPWGGIVKFFVSSPQGATVSLTENTTNRITTEVASGAGGTVYYVESSGFLNGHGGSNIIYVESGGIATNNGSGSNNYFLETGSTLNCCGGGGSNTVYYETGAVINNTGGMILNQVSDVSATFLPALYNYDHIPVNTPPIADAGEDQALIQVGTLVQLDGSGSFDDDGDAFTYNWVFESKPLTSKAVLDDPTAVNPTFTADIQGEYTISLTATDTGNEVSSPDTVIVSFDNIVPIADAGGNQTAVVSDTIILDGSNSSDANIDVLTYQWEIIHLPVESAVSLTSTSTVTTSFIADLPGTYVVRLTVNDGQIDSVPGISTITVISQLDSVTRTVMDLVDVVNGFESGVFKNSNRQNTYVNKLGVILAMIDNGDFADALDKLQNDILKKADGCLNGDAPDNNDWVTACAAQDDVVPLLLDAENLLQTLLQ